VPHERAVYLAFMRHQPESLLESRLMVDILVEVQLVEVSNGGVGAINTHAALSFKPSLRSTRRPEGTILILRSIDIAALRFIRLSRSGFARTLLPSRHVWIPAKQAVSPIREAVKF
jgi:hypothetical protein